MPKLTRFLLNTPDATRPASDPVEAPAFSLTKVLSVAAVVLTPLTTVLVRVIEETPFSTWQVVALILGVLGFLAITASADVLARARAVGAAPPPSLHEWAELDPALRARLESPALDPDVDVLAVRRDHEGTRFLVREEDKAPTWVAQAALRF